MLYLKNLDSPDCSPLTKNTIQSFPNGRVFVFRPNGERDNPLYMVETRKSGRFSINLHGWCSGNGGLGILSCVGRLNTDNYIELLEATVFPVIRDEFPEHNFHFMHDRAPAHTSNRTLNFIRDEFPEINDLMLSWPPKGADLNIIENIWSLLA